jgi:hypothetical protein
MSIVGPSCARCGRNAVMEQILNEAKRRGDLDE